LPSAAHPWAEWPCAALSGGMLASLADQTRKLVLGRGIGSESLGGRRRWSMVNLYERLIGQLDTLVPFLALAHEQVFEVVLQEYSHWVSADDQEAIPDTYAVFENQISQAAFLLGYSYFEAFLADLIRQLYAHNPNMLPRDKQLSFAEVVRCSDYASVVERMIDKEILSVFYKSMEEVLEYFRDKLSIKWPDDHRMIEASLLRNCLVHTMGRADARLAHVSHWKEGQAIELTPEEVHDFGVEARAVAGALYEQVSKRLKQHHQASR